MTLVLYGQNGYVGREIVDFFSKDWKFIFPRLRIGKETDNEILRELDEIRNGGAQVLINCIGCSVKRSELDPSLLFSSIQSNVYAPFFLAKFGPLYGFHVVNYSTAAVVNGSEGYDESYMPNNYLQNYSILKSNADKIVCRNVKVLNLRQGPVITDGDKGNCLLRKLIRDFNRLYSEPLSLSVYPELLKALEVMIRNKTEGTVNFVNPGAEYLPKICELINEVLGIGKKWEISQLSDAKKLDPAAGPQTLLSSAKIEAICPDLRTAYECIKEILETNKEKLLAAYKITWE